MRKIFVFLLIIILIIGCKPVKKVQSIHEALSQKDTAQTVAIKTIEKVDSVAIIKNVLQKALKNKVDFSTFNAKIKVDYYGTEESQSVTVYLSIKKDSIMYLQIKGLLGVVGLQAIITPDSVVVVKKVGEKYIQKRAISYLQEVTQIPFTYYTLQDLLMGNAVFADSTNIFSYRATNNNEILVQTVGKVFKNLLTINSDFLITHSKLDDVNELRNRTCDITYGNYVTVDSFKFSTFRDVSVAEKSKLDVVMDFKEYWFNETLKYVFTLPKKMKVK